MISKEEIEKEHVEKWLQANEIPQFVKNYIKQLENKFNEYVQVEQTADSISFTLPIEVAKEFDKTMTNIDIANENKRLKAREQKLIEKLEEDIKELEILHDNYVDANIIEGTYETLGKINYAKKILEIVKGK